MNRNAALYALMLGTISTCAYAAPATKQAPAPEGQKDLIALKEQIEGQRSKIDKQEQRLKQQLDAVMRQQEELNQQRDKIAQMQQMLEKASGGKVTLAPAAPRPASAVASDSSPSESQKVATDYKPENADRPPEIQSLTDVGGVLTPKGQFVLESGLEYTNSSAVRVALEGYTIIPALNIGLFDISRVSRDMAIASVTGRYGVTSRFEIDAKLPYVYRDDSTFSRPFGVGAASDTLTNTSGDGLGDVEIGAHYQLNNGQDGWPFLIANARFKSITGTSPYEVPIDPDTGLELELPTGSGFYALQPSLTAILPADPVVFYGNIGYLFNMERNVGGAYGTIDPGDSVNLSFGMGVSLNEKASFSIGYSHDVVMIPKQNGQNIPLADTLQVGVLDVGYSYRVSPKTSLNLNVGAGLTEDSPDVRVSLRVPYRFGTGTK